MNENKITQIELSERTGIALNTIRGWYSKDVIPDVLLAYKIAKVLNVSLDFLVTGSESNLYKDKLNEIKAAIDSLQRLLN